VLQVVTGVYRLLQVITGLQVRVREGIEWGRNRYRLLQVVTGYVRAFGTRSENGGMEVGDIKINDGLFIEGTVIFPHSPRYGRGLKGREIVTGCYR
jgi:hypothetical protein